MPFTENRTFWRTKPEKEVSGRAQWSSLLLRNWRIEELAGFAIEQGEAEAGSGLAEAT